MTTDAKEPEAPTRPEPPPGLTLVPTLRHLERQYGREELEAAWKFWGDEAKYAKSAREYTREMEGYHAALAQHERSQRETAATADGGN